MRCQICKEANVTIQNPPVVIRSGEQPSWLIFNDFGVGERENYNPHLFNRLSWIVGVIYFLSPYKHYTDPEATDENINKLTEPDLFFLNKLNKVKNDLLIVEERDPLGVIHYHYLYNTNQRTDNAKRSLKDALNYNVPNTLNITANQCKNLHSYLTYLWKNPNVIITNNIFLAKYFWSVKYHAITGETELINTATSIKDFTHTLTHLIPKYNIQTWENCMQKIPQLTQKFLHISNIEHIFQNTLHWCEQNKPNCAELYKDLILNSNTCCNANHKIIEKILMHQEIHITEFAHDLLKWLLRTEVKKNTFILQGPGNTGKSVVARSFSRLFDKVGEILSNSNFAFQNLFGKQLILWEEPIINENLSEKIKLIMEGKATEVDVKMKQPKVLYPAPLLITTNHDIWHWCQMNKDTYMLRSYRYFFLHQIQFTHDNPCTLSDDNEHRQSLYCNNFPNTNSPQDTTDNSSTERQHSDTEQQPSTSGQNDNRTTDNRTTISSTVEASPIKRQRREYVTEKKAQRDNNILGRDVSTTNSNKLLIPHACDWIKFLQINYHDLEEVINE
uniref:NS1 protein n=1 Tax=Mops bat parvovirus TaxID=3141925 RepID=A0AAU7E1N5_9VIRU